MSEPSTNSSMKNGPMTILFEPPLTSSPQRSLTLCPTDMGRSVLSTYETECAILRASESALKQFDDATQVPTVRPLFRLLLAWTGHVRSRSEGPFPPKTKAWTMWRSLLGLDHDATRSTFTCFPHVAHVDTPWPATLGGR